MNRTDAYARATDPETSAAAAESIKPTELEGAVLSCLRTFSDGAITHEIAERMNLTPWSISPRMKPLRAKGLIEDSGHKRAWHTGRASIVWRVKRRFEQLDLLGAP